MRSGVVGLLPSDLTTITSAKARYLRTLGFTGISIILGEPDSYSLRDLHRARDILTGEGVAIAQANGTYPSLVDPDESIRNAGIEGLKRHMRSAQALAADTIYVRPGSLSHSGPWTPHRNHHKEAAFERVISSINSLAVAAESEGITLAIEGHILSVLDRPQRIVKLLECIPMKSLSFNLDPVNFLGSIWDAWNPQPIYESLLQAARGRLKVAHWKDYIVENDLVLRITEVPIGKGLIEHSSWLTQLNKMAPDSWVLLEHLRPEQVPHAKEALDKEMHAAGLAWDL